MAKTTSDYPGAIDTFDNEAVDFNPGDAVPSSDFEKMMDAIKKIETELGTDPAGASADVATRLGNVTAAEFSQLETMGDTTILASQWGFLGAMTQHPLAGDSIAGRKLRASYLRIDNGTNAETLKCTVGSRWNGNTIAETDNIAKNATTGDFSLSADGKKLTIKASGLTGNALHSLGSVSRNLCTTDLTILAKAAANDIEIEVYNTSAGANLDLTVLVDTGLIEVEILYVTDA